ncbi:hypothetical protein KI387_041450, partial [Taxus chinensis]
MIRGMDVSHYLELEETRAILSIGCGRLGYLMNSKSLPNPEEPKEVCWKKDFLPKAGTFAWLALQNRILMCDRAVGIALFSPLSPLASSDPFIWNSFVRTESPAESNPDPQDPVLAIHPACIYVGDVASDMAFGPCIYKMMNGIVALYSPMQKEGNGALCSAGCIGAPTSAHPTQSQSIGG